MNPVIKRLAAGLGILPLAFVGQLHAHHPMGGEAPATLFQGFASGLAHPVIDVEHALFIIAVAVLASLATRLRPLHWLGFIGMTVLGATLHYLGWHSGVAELAIALSLVVAGVFMVLGRSGAGWLTGGFLVIAGLFHGYGYGETIIGSEMGPVLAYLLGFSLIQALLLVLLTVGLQYMRKRLGRHHATALRAAGVAVVAVGGVLLFA
ncbi:MAG: HupE/UreJ family protein [Ectothiorhodospiraceae bacterium]|nr:HupE/UreJ family protein [Ectothiorhodospiraceae bacterium]